MPDAGRDDRINRFGEKPMRKSILGLSALITLSVATPALAQDETSDDLGLKVTGTAAIVSDYRFRGFSQTGEDPAAQAGITVTHKSGFYVGTWASTIDLPAVGNSLNTEIDLFAGYSKEIKPGLTVDAGLLYYLYPAHGVTNDTDFFEPYVNLTGTFGPASLKVGANYSWKQSALRDAFGDKASAIYLHAEPSVTIPNSPIGLNAHVGYAKSDAFPGGGEGDGHVWDYSVGGTVTWKNLTLGVSYVDTDEPSAIAETAGSDGAVVFSLTAAF